jgi:anti-sigma regulatory factor (Ser/Thr protein kinase)
MSGENAERKKIGSIDKFLESDIEAETIEVKVPPKSKYLPLLRAAAGVVAGGLELDYDEILQLRVAVSEAFDMVTRQIGSNEAIDDSSEIVTVFVIRPDRLEVLVGDPGFRRGAAEDSKEKESRVILESLVDAVEIGAEERGHRVIKLVKRRSSEEVSP